MFAAHNLLLTPPPTAATSVAIINSGSVQSTSITIPTHQVGDTIIIFAWANATTTPPSKPTASGTIPAWVDIDANTGANNCASRTAYFNAVATNTTSGTWLNATHMIVVLLRGGSPSPIGGHAESGGTTSGTSPYPAIAPAVTMKNTDGTSALLHFYCAGSINTWSAAPTGFTRLQAIGGSSGAGACANSKNVTTSDGSSSDGTGWSLSEGYRGAAVEVVSY